MHPGTIGKEAHRAVDLQPAVPQAVDDDVAGGLPRRPVRARHAYSLPAAARGRQHRLDLDSEPALDTLVGGDRRSEHPAEGRQLHGDLGRLHQWLGIVAGNRRRRLGQIEREETVRPLAQIGLRAILRDEVAIASLNSLVVLAHTRAVHQRIVHDVVDEGAALDLGPVDFTPHEPFDQARKLQGGLQHQKRGSHARVVGIDEPQMDLAFVAQAGAIERPRRAVHEGDAVVLLRQGQRRARPLEYRLPSTTARFTACLSPCSASHRCDGRRRSESR